ncbi:MAG TPA: hypothetical protein VMG62_05325 [Solirubrobacteraceae bacterium]|nr:hypothetical protein [Solirubrobacteraceae bacterium]
MRSSSTRLDRQIDDLLLAVSVATRALYVRRKLHRLRARLLHLAALAAGAGAFAVLLLVAALLLRRRRVS